MSPNMCMEPNKPLQLMSFGDWQPREIEKILCVEEYEHTPQTPP